MWQSIIDKLKAGDGALSSALWMGLGLVFLVIVVLLVVWIMRALRPSLNMNTAAARGGRPLRLAVTDAFTLDREGRKLVIIRRDNVEHLLLIGGPNDVVIEPNIVRSERAIRDRPPRTEPAEAPAPAHAPRKELQRNAPAQVSPPPAPVSPAFQQPIRRAGPPAEEPRTGIPSAPVLSQKMDEDFERALAAMAAQQPLQAQKSVAAPPPSPPVAPPSMQMQSRPEPVSDMARRLNEVLQKPLGMQPRPTPPPAQNAGRKPAASEAKPAAATKPVDIPPARSPKPLEPASALPASDMIKAQVDSDMDMLEEEMARLLGRPAPPQKTAGS